MNTRLLFSTTLAMHFSAYDYKMATFIDDQVKRFCERMK